MDDTIEICIYTWFIIVKPIVTSVTEIGFSNLLCKSLQPSKSLRDFDGNGNETRIVYRHSVTTGYEVRNRLTSRTSLPPHDTGIVALAVGRNL